MIIAKEKVSQILQEAIESCIEKGVISGENLPKGKIEYPKDEKFGDFASPFAMESARLLKKNPLQIAQSLVGILKENTLFEKVEVVKPGFINFYLSKSFLAEIVTEVNDLKINYGKIKNNNPKKISLEFVSANPTGPLNIVSARAAAVGDTLANVLEAAGHTVDREFYVNDYGNQVRLLGLSVLSRYKELKGIETIFPEDGYQGEYIKDIAASLASDIEIDLRSGKSEEEIADACSIKAIEYNVASQKKIMKMFGVEYQQWFSERTLHEDGSVMDTFEDLKKMNVIYDDEGKKVFRSTDFGDDKDRVVIRDDGRPTYLLADIAYHRNKYKRGYDKVLDIWGPDHHGYIARLAGAMTALGYEKDSFKVLIAQQVNLIMEGELVKMSKRLGRFSTMEELITEIGVDVSRFFFVMRSMDSHLDFDLALAKKQSSENPVFYLQYAHARICSIFREAEDRGIKYNMQVEQSYLNSNEILILMKNISKFPDEILDAAESLEGHRITNYLLKLSQSFHKFYSEHRILSNETGARDTLLALCNAVKIILKNGLELVGVNAPEKM